MAFTIPNEADAAFAAQAAPDKVDIDILVAGVGGTGVISGCAVTAQGTPDMTLAVASGSVRVGSTVATVSAGNVTITAANATNPRFDLVVVDSAGAKSVTAGIAAASPAFPSIPANSVVVAAVYVPAADTAINTNQIVDKRVLLVVPGQLLAAVSYNPATSVAPSTTSSTFADVDAGLAATFRAPASGKVLVGLTARTLVASSTTIEWNLRDGSGDIAGTAGPVARGPGATIAPRCTHRALVTGLTPGQEYTWKWGHARTNGSGNAWTLAGLSTQASVDSTAPGPAVMEVYAVP